MNTLITKAKFFFSTYKWLLFPLVPIIIFIFIIAYIFYAQKNPTPQTTKQQNNPEVSQTQVSEAPDEHTEISPNDDHPYGLADEVQGVAFGKQQFLVSGTTDEDGGGEGYGSNDEFADGSISDKTLSDGSVEYEYQSEDTQRPHMQIVKNGVVLFRRNLMPDDTTTDYYSSYLQNPEYTSQGSSYFGSNAMIYASPTNGVAIVFNPQTEQVYEQYLFPAISVDDYLKKFGPDITSFNPGP